MEEDIKILEKLKNDGKETFTDTKLADYEIQAIEHLIKVYRKIKEKIKVLEKLQNEFKDNEELRIKIIAYKELLEED